MQSAWYVTFHQIRSLQTYLREGPPLPNFTKIRPVGAAVIHTGRWTDGHDEANKRFSLFTRTRLTRAGETASRAKKLTDDVSLRAHQCEQQIGSGRRYSIFSQTQSPGGNNETAARVDTVTECYPVTARSLTFKREAELAYRPYSETGRELQPTAQQMSVTRYLPAKPSVLVSANSTHSMEKAHRLKKSLFLNWALYNLSPVIHN
jgi:hypothetical protein